MDLPTSGWSRSSRQKKVYFAETNYNSDNQAKLQADAQKAGDVPLTIAASAERGGSADARVQVNSSRLVAVSNATFVQDSAIMQDRTALDFVSSDRTRDGLYRRLQVILRDPNLTAQARKGYYPAKD